MSISSSSTHTHCLINFLKNASEGLSEVDAYFIESRAVCNRYIQDFAVAILSFRLKFCRRIVLAFPNNATIEFPRCKHPSVKVISTRSAHSTVFYPPCKRFSKLFLEALLPPSILERGAQYRVRAQSVNDFSQIRYDSVTVTRTNRFLPH